MTANADSLLTDAAARREGGFTLLELLVTLTILGLALVVVAGYKPPWSRTLGLTGAAAQIASGLRDARAESIARNRPVDFAIDVEKHRFRIGAGPVRPLPPELALTLLTVAGERRDSHTGGIRFNPDGSSTGGRIELADDRGRIAVGVDWLTGRVSLDDRY